MQDGPRHHHMQMKYMLAQMALMNPERFFATFGPGGDPCFLSDLWASMGQSLPKDQQVPSDGTGAWHRRDDGGLEVVVLTLPPPATRNEAYFVGAVRLPSGVCRAFALERAVIPATGQEFTILSELALNGRSNWGPGTASTVEEFADMLLRVVSDPKLRPIAFVPMNLR